MLTSSEIRSRFLEFFKKRGHVIVPSSSLVPEGDSSVLFTTAGMQQFKPYYTGLLDAEKDFGSKNVTSSQKCVRTGDIDEVGDNTHLTFFEMLGNFSFGGYGRREAITYGYEFITKELGLEISYVTFFKGNEYVPRDSESESIWKELGIKDVREDGSDVFWGPTGDSGPCGPTTEIYCKNASREDVEVWNIVFNEYFCNGSREQLDKGEAKLEKLPVMGIDTGMGLERLLATVQNVKSVYDTDLFTQEIQAPHKNFMSWFEYFKDLQDGKSYKESSARIIMDHIRTVTFLISDGVSPDNKGRGYVLRRLIRRSIVEIGKIGFGDSTLVNIAHSYIRKYSSIYPNLQNDNIARLINEEAHKFSESFGEWRQKLIRMIDFKNLSATAQADFIFDSFQSFGIPWDIAVSEIAIYQGVKISNDIKNLFDQRLVEHQKLSQSGSAGMFKGGLANTNEMTVKLHTAHHLLLSALQEVLGKQVKQRGSNITEERLRIDFNFDRKVTPEELEKISTLVNGWIAEKLPVVRREMPREEAEKLGAEMEFGAKYPDMVSVYTIQNSKDEYVSKEFCGGPHVTNTGDLGHFEIQKEEASSAGIRRIKARLN